MTQRTFSQATRIIALRLLQVIGQHRFAFAAFLVPLSIRIIPEILSGPYPVGWDIVAYYIPNAIDIVSGKMNVWGMITSPPVMYAIVVPAYLLTRANLVLIFKILGPILYGLLGWSIFWFSQRRLHWSSRKALCAVLFISAYFVTLRISWDAYQMELGLAFFLLAESIRLSSPTKSALGRVSLLCLAVLSNQSVGVLVVGAQLAAFVLPSIRKSPKLFSLQFAPIAFFLLILYSTMQTVLAPGLSIVGPGASLSILTTNLAFLFYAYIFVIPLLLFGIKLRERSVFVPWMIVCGIGLSLSVLPGHVFQDIAYRWVLLLSLPLLFLAYEGYSRLQLSSTYMRKNSGCLLRHVLIVSLSSSAISYAILPS